MTASKSSRARAARAQQAQRTRAVQASAARNGGAAGRANGNGTAVRAGSQSRAVAARGGRGRGVSGRTQEATAEAPSTTTVPRWMQYLTFALAIAGLGVSIYLTYAHFTESHLLGCAESSLINCTKVTTSPQSYVFGIPVAVLGRAFYLAAVALMSPWGPLGWRSPWREVHLIRIASLVVGIGFVLYLVYAELFIIGSICLYCTSVHAITFLLFVLTAFAAATSGLPKRQRV
jgi:uncharacterized membrane protein